MKLFKRHKNPTGFTLIELLISISIITILLTLTITLINPARQFSKANNAKRYSDINAILNAIGQYAADNKGAIPTAITTSTQTISNTGANICSSLVPLYLASLPVDPSTNNGAAITDCESAYNTTYSIMKGATDNRVTVSAPGAEVGETISVTR